MARIETSLTEFHNFVERSVAADTPAAGSWNAFFKANGLNVINEDGDVTPVMSPFDLPDWNYRAEYSIWLMGQEPSGELWKLRGDTLRNYGIFILDSSSYAAISESLMFIDFDSTTSRTLTITDSTILEGHSLKAKASQIEIGTPHKILLPVGVTWDGTNRAALITLTTDRLEAIAISTTRFSLWNSTGVTFAAS